MDNYNNNLFDYFIWNDIYHLKIYIVSSLIKSLLFQDSEIRIMPQVLPNTVYIVPSLLCMCLLYDLKSKYACMVIFIFFKGLSHCLWCPVDDWYWNCTESVFMLLTDDFTLPCYFTKCLKISVSIQIKN